RAVGENHASWSDKLDDTLWAFRTAYKTPIGCTPYKLVYEKACHLPVKLEHKPYWALKNANFDLKTAGDHRKIQINELNELRGQAYENSLIYKEKIKSIPENLKTHTEGFCPPVFISSASLRNHSSEGVYRARKPLKSSRLAIMDLQEVIMAQITQLESGQVEVSNRGLKCILERAVGENHASWSDKLDDTLWAFRTTYKTPIGCTPYKLVYEKAYHLPVELEHKPYRALKNANFDLKTAGDHRKIQINELNELRDQAYENSLIYKEKIKRYHDSKIKNRIFNIGNRVLLFNSRLKIFSSKLKSRWSGPFIISQVYPYGIVEFS
nr:reverse transcriptase domain-containing protein [Tanacetum cinerariifolium]